MQLVSIRCTTLSDQNVACVVPLDKQERVVETCDMQTCFPIHCSATYRD